MATLKGPGQAENHHGANLRVAIVHARWNSPIIEALVGGAKKRMLALGVKEENIIIESVPGSYELPFAVQRIYTASHVQAASIASGTVGSATTDLLSSPTSDPRKLTPAAGPNPDTMSPQLAPAATPFDAIIAIGVLIKGETMHFEYIADAVSHGLMRVQLDTGVPVIFGLLTVLTEEQGLVRAGMVKDKAGNQHNHGEDWGSAAVELGVKRKAWDGGRLA
ncbi:6,7-dimethyl-8-ribityllumazine synthase [Uncinocarpus reesii 1704]|uniref:6,7-dimethyl-8-ribityllumazine synthase n=1 Tax=Uncinocarpus reesii (strain UAMH 1704) TaxID=336963 RepID=C4K072_UNCRE|nr:6,7-dimethyl-8-ribityllumazine synthase [Uncinocarpus reesii 1704]EEP82958.1 6,7-dimethyl-8-ribityllumazine synthase [Uncinocarpus reesii 1704]